MLFRQKLCALLFCVPAPQDGFTVMRRNCVNYVGIFGTPVCLSFAVCIPALLNSPSAEKHTRFSISLCLALNLSFEFILLFSVLLLYVADIVDGG